MRKLLTVLLTVAVVFSMALAPAVASDSSPPTLLYAVMVETTVTAPQREQCAYYNDSRGEVREAGPAGLTSGANDLWYLPYDHGPVPTVLRV